MAKKKTAAVAAQAEQTNTTTEPTTANVAPITESPADKMRRIRAERDAKAAARKAEVDAKKETRAAARAEKDAQRQAKRAARAEARAAKGLPVDDDADDKGPRETFTFTDGFEVTVRRGAKIIWRLHDDQGRTQYFGTASSRGRAYIRIGGCFTRRNAPENLQAEILEHKPAELAVAA